MSVPTRFEPNEYMICFEIVKFKLLQILSHIPFFFSPSLCPKHIFDLCSPETVITN